MGWLNGSFCNCTLNFNQTSLERDPWLEEDEYDVYEGNFTLYWGNSRKNAATLFLMFTIYKKYINEDHIPINSLALGTEYWCDHWTPT